MTLREQTENLARLRDTETKAENALKAAEHEYRKAAAPLFRAMEDAKTARFEAETALRNAARLEFLDTGDKNPAPGIGIRLTKKLHYDDSEAFAWARERNVCLTLDRKAFEKIGASLPFVEEQTEPVVTVATDLFGAVMEAERKAQVSP